MKKWRQIYVFLPETSFKFTRLGQATSKGLILHLELLCPFQINMIHLKHDKLA